MIREKSIQDRMSAGFSLIELLVVLAILSILALAIMPLAELSSKRAKETELRRVLWVVRDAVDEYKRLSDAGRIKRNIGDSGYPKTLEELESGMPDLADPAARKIYLLRRVPTDPFAEPGLIGAKSWGLRSYASPPDKPKEGDDVFDVFSLNDGVGLNGVPYRQW